MIIRIFYFKRDQQKHSYAADHRSWRSLANYVAAAAALAVPVAVAVAVPVAVV